MIIELKDGTRYDIADFSCRRLYDYIPSVEVIHNTKTVLGRGPVFGKSYYGTRTLDVKMYYKAKGIADFYRLRDELNYLFSIKESFYIIFKKAPDKRYLARVASQLNLEPSRTSREFTVSFILEKPFAESVQRYSFVYNTLTFKVNNDGNEVIDPRAYDLEIKLKGEFASIVTIKNNTTNETFSLKAGLKSTDTLILRDAKAYINGTSVFKNTNHKVLTLAPGENSFSITGGTVSSVEILTRFLYR